MGTVWPGGLTGASTIGYTDGYTSERMIADILGHREVRITQQAYLRTTDAQRRAALQSAALELLAVD